MASYFDPEAHQELSREDKQAAKSIVPSFMKKESQSIGNTSTSICSVVAKTNHTLTDKLKIMVGMLTNVKQSRTLTIEDELFLFT